MSLFLRKNSLLRCWGCILGWGFYIISVVKTASRKIGALIRYMIPPVVAFSISEDLPYDLVWNIVFMFGLLLLDAIWKC